MRHNEDRELDIKIAELQANIQIFIAAAFGYFGVFAAAAFCFLQAMLTIGIEEIAFKTMFGVLGILASILAASFAFYFARKAIKTRDQIKDLRKQYVW